MTRSAGILVYRHTVGGLQALLAHPGGPFWRRKDAGAWSIPKGEILPGENELQAALREFEEETGVRLGGEFLPLGEARQSGGKLVAAWAVAADLDPTTFHSNTFEIEWPPRSGRLQRFPEIDRAAWFDIATARGKILKSQQPFLDRLVQALDRTETAPGPK